MLLKACLNGARHRTDHARCPVTAAELAADGERAVSAGAHALHIHPRGTDGRESLAAADVAAALSRMREVVGVPIGVTTGSWVLSDPDERLRVVGAWTVFPDFASVNIHEPGAVELARALLDRGIGVEAGVWTAGAAGILVDSGLATRCLRILLEPGDDDVTAAVVTVEAIERRLEDAAPGVPRLLHGVDATCWAVLDLAVQRGYDTRMGLEDTLLRPDGVVAEDNAELIRIATARLRVAGRLDDAMEMSR